MKVVLIIPPFTQINTPYPSASQLSGYLKSKEIESVVYDLSLEVMLRVLSKKGLKEIFNLVEKNKQLDLNSKRMLSLKETYIDVVDGVVNFLQGKNSNFAYKVITQNFLPHGKSFENLVGEKEAFGNLGINDKAKHLCSLFIDDITLFIQKNITHHFGLSRYAERIAFSPAEFDGIEEELKGNRNIIESYIIDETQKIIEKEKPDLVGFTIPFPGNFLSALLSAKFIKEKYSGIKIVFGGGYINTELRDIKDKRIFSYTDYITLDDGEIPLYNIISKIKYPNQDIGFVRTLCVVNENIVYSDEGLNKNISHNQIIAPDVSNLDPQKYISMVEMLNPMHRLWSDGYWNKLAIAHGCYWSKCTFCDVTLDYIGRYSPAGASVIVDWMESMIAQNNITAFHLTDEAAPPALLKELSLEILARKLSVTWWGNIRFEKAFTKDLCMLLAASGCVAVSGGIECADERLLKLINKGVTLEQAAISCYNFQNAGIMVHAYLMYGFPTQTEQETINSLEIVRQFMKNGLFQSAFWHLFTLTVHSPIAKNPKEYGVTIKSSVNNNFANNDLLHTDDSKTNHSMYADGLKKALYNYMHGIGFEFNIKDWFEFPVASTTIPKNLVSKFLINKTPININSRKQSVWLAGLPELRNINNDICELTIHSASVEGSWKIKKGLAEWLVKCIQKSMKSELRDKFLFSDWESSFPGNAADFEKFVQSKTWKELREHFLLFV